MQIDLKLVIDLPPVTKKNHQEIHKKADGGRFIANGHAYRSYEKDAVWLLARYGHPHIDTPVNVKCIYYMPTRRRVDLVNLLEATCDVLVRAGILKDDNCSIIIGHDGSRVLHDKRNPRTEITIKGVPDDERIFPVPPGKQRRIKAVKP